MAFRAETARAVSGFRPSVVPNLIYGVSSFKSRKNGLSFSSGTGTVNHPKNIHDTVDLAPANVGLSAAEMQLVPLVAREMRLKNAILAVADDYDFILIDCPPSLGLLSILGLVASTHVLVPVQTQVKSFEGTDLLLKTVADIKSLVNRSLSFAGFIPTLYDKRTIHQYEVYKAISTQLSQLAPVYEPIPHTIAFPDSSLKRLPLALYKPNHPAVHIIESIAQQLEQL